MEELRFRQIHMDFHTSPLISGVGEEFKAKEFAQTLKEAYVNSVTCFAKCHHGMIWSIILMRVMPPALFLRLKAIR